MKEVWEKEIIDWLEQKIDFCGIRQYPDVPKDYFLKHKTGEVLVRYDSTKWDQKDVSNSYQEGKVRVELILVFRKLRGNNGLYDTSSLIKEALYNKRPTGSINGMQFESEDLISEEDGIWQYGIKIVFPCLWVPKEDKAPVAKNVNVAINSKSCGG